MLEVARIHAERVGDAASAGPGVRVDGSNLEDVLKTGRAVTDYVRENGPAMLQVHTLF